MHVLPHLSTPRPPTCTRWRQHQVRSDRVNVTLARRWNSSSVGCRERRGDVRLDQAKLAAVPRRLPGARPPQSSRPWRKAARRTAFQASVPGKSPFPYGHWLVDSGTHLVTGVSLLQLLGTVGTNPCSQPTARHTFSVVTLPWLHLVPSSLFPSPLS